MAPCLRRNLPPRRLWLSDHARPLTMRHVIFVMMLVGVMLCSGHDSFAAAAPRKAKERQAEPYVYVSGGVHKPGRYDWTKSMTLIDAIQAAGGFTDSAGRRVTIFHFDGAREFYTRGGTNAPPILKAGDRISVPKRLF